jgi:putative SOS response-associated peptidase YedK
MATWRMTLPVTQNLPVLDDVGLGMHISKLILGAAHHFGPFDPPRTDLECQESGTTKTPYVIVPSDEPLFAFAGLWENWRDKAAGGDAEWIRTCAIITGPPNELVAPIHDRMPVILPSEVWARWLGEEEAGKDELQSLLKPCPAERIRAYSISTRVNSVKNDDAGLIEPMMATGGDTV